MSFRLRVTLAAAAAVAIAVAAASAVVYVVVRHQLTGEVDRSLVDRARRFVEHPGGPFGPGFVEPGPRQDLGDPTFLQVITPSGVGAVVELPCLSEAEQVAEAGGRPFYCDGSVENTHVPNPEAIPVFGDGLLV